MRDQLDKDSNRKEDISGTFNGIFEGLGISSFTKFNGFFYQDSPMRANASQVPAFSLKIVVTYNEKYCDSPEDEIERVAFHEGQHAITRADYLREMREEGRKISSLYAFALHPSFHSLHQRITNYFYEKVDEGVEFGKTVDPPYSHYSELSNTKSYTHPEEVLALLRAYQHYLDQIDAGMDVTTQPYEFIEAFEEEDLRFLDQELRMELKQEVMEQNPEAFS